MNHAVDRPSATAQDFSSESLAHSSKLTARAASRLLSALSHNNSTNSHEPNGNNKDMDQNPSKNSRKIKVSRPSRQAVGVAMVYVLFLLQRWLTQEEGQLPKAVHFFYFFFCLKFCLIEKIIIFFFHTSFFS
jgi:hypothetical protein